ncbi:MAG: radical SAM protein, partial [Myxococcota bacterium]|nr:radical SAM protein [Myxococcota bacterium]
MKVLLIAPPERFLQPNGPAHFDWPLGLSYIGAALHRAGHTVRTLLPDTRSCQTDDPWPLLRAVIEQEAPQVVGITSTSATFPAAMRLVSETRTALGEEVLVMLGGAHVTFRPADGARQPGVDAVIVGEGEDAVVTLVDGWAAQGRGFEVTSVPGVAAWRGDALIRGPRRETRSDLDALPWPHRDGLVWQQDVHPALYQGLITLRGCPYSCIYCAIPSADDRRTRYRSPADIVAEARYLRDTRGIRYLQFYDSVFTLHRRRTLELVEGLAELDMRFACQTRADRVDEPLLDAMKTAGCEVIYFGVESGDEGSLKRLKKAMPLDTVRQAVRWVRDRGIRVNGFFMVGFPWETSELIERTVDFALDLGLDRVSLFSTTPLPGTELWDLAPDTPAYGL